MMMVNEPSFKSILSLTVVNTCFKLAAYTFTTSFRLNIEYSATFDSLTGNNDSEGGMAMLQLKDIMTPIDTFLRPESQLRTTIEYMKKFKWTALPVTDDENRLLGVITRSIIYQLILEGKPLDTPIKNFIKTEDVIAHPYDTPYEEVEKYVRNSKAGTGIVFDEQNKVIGLCRTSDMIITLFRSTHSLKEQLEVILESSQLGVLVTNEHKQITFANDKLAEITRCHIHELLDLPIEQVVLGIKIGNENIGTHQRVKIADSQLLARISSHNMLSGNKGWIIILQNVTEVETMAQELQTIKKWKSRLESVIKNTYDGIVMINENSEIIYINAQLLELFSLEQKDYYKTNINQLLPDLELSYVLSTGTADISDFKQINGINYYVHRIPVYQDDELIGAIGTISYRQLQEVSERFKRFHAESNSLLIKKHGRFTFDDIISADPQLEKLKRSIRKASKGKSTILIRGESGTGKELFAHAIHNESLRKEGPFVTVNCAAIPEHLLETEFFGYEEGAFTGANRKGKLGKFDAANGGTLFLDEIGDMSLQLQAKLLRVLQEKEFYRVGGVEQIHVDVRIIAATNRPLEEMVDQGVFREDLFYRLNVISFIIPPLRNRIGDIMLLSELIIKQLNQSLGTSITGMKNDVQALFKNYEWPGNVRELKNVLERAMTFAEHGKIQLEDLPEYLADQAVRQAITEESGLLQTNEKKVILEALRKTNGNKSEAAKLLGINRSVLYSKLKKYQ